MKNIEIMEETKDENRTNRRKINKKTIKWKKIEHMEDE